MECIFALLLDSGKKAKGVKTLMVTGRGNTPIPVATMLNSPHSDKLRHTDESGAVIPRPAADIAPLTIAFSNAVSKQWQKYVPSSIAPCKYSIRRLTPVIAGDWTLHSAQELYGKTIRDLKALLDESAIWKPVFRTLLIDLYNDYLHAAMNAMRNGVAA